MTGSIFSVFLWFFLDFLTLKWPFLKASLAKSKIFCQRWFNNIFFDILEFFEIFNMNGSKDIPIWKCIDLLYNALSYFNILETYIWVLVLIRNKKIFCHFAKSNPAGDENLWYFFISPYVHYVQGQSRKEVMTFATLDPRHGIEMSEMSPSKTTGFPWNSRKYWKKCRIDLESRTF